MRLLIALLLFFTLTAFTGLKTSPAITAASDTSRKAPTKEIHFPDPAGVSRLFYVQRDPNTNTVIYELNADRNGELDADQPVHPYWIKYADKGQKDELNYIQRKFAYGLNTKQVKPGVFDVRFVCYKKLVMTLMKHTDGKYHIFATIGKKQAILNRIFAKIEGGSFWLPNIVYVELKGIETETGKEITERFKP